MNLTKSIFAVIKIDCGKPKLNAIFIENDFINAKLWFQGYITGDKIQPVNWALYKIGEINEELKLKGFKIFVCTGAQVCKTEKEKKYEQLKILEEKIEERKKAENLRKMFKEGYSLEEAIKIEFEGRNI